MAHWNAPILPKQTQSALSGASIGEVDLAFPSFMGIFWFDGQMDYTSILAGFAEVHAAFGLGNGLGIGVSGIDSSNADAVSTVLAVSKPPFSWRIGLRQYDSIRMTPAML